MQQQVTDLQDQVTELSAEVGTLSASLAALRDQVARLERRADRTARAARSSESQSSITPNGAGETPESEPPVSGSPGYRSAPPTPASETSGGQSVPSWLQREAIADQIGQFLLRALSGDHRASSGRDLIPLASRIWVVVQDIDGNRYNPVRVFRSWSAAKALVKRGQDVGDSIFVGLPSEREARRAVHTATLLWPEA